MKYKSVKEIMRDDSLSLPEIQETIDNFLNEKGMTADEFFYETELWCQTISFIHSFTQQLFIEIVCLYSRLWRYNEKDKQNIQVSTALKS